MLALILEFAPVQGEFAPVQEFKADQIRCGRLTYPTLRTPLNCNKAEYDPFPAGRRTSWRQKLSIVYRVL